MLTDKSESTTENEIKCLENSLQENNELDKQRTDKECKSADNNDNFYSYDLVGRKTKDYFQVKSGVPPTTMPGHTGYLTFASLYL